jgi:hypothetical protein
MKLDTYIVWGISAVGAIIGFFVFGLTGLGEIPLLILTFVGAIGGAIVGTKIVQKRANPASGTSPAPDPGPGNGKTEA